MLIYGDPKTSATIGEALRALHGLEGEDFLIACGMLEQGLADIGIELGEDLPSGLPLEKRIDLKTPEGFAFYQLYPEQYRRATKTWLQAAPRGGPIVVIGIRSIGTTLSRVVCEELQTAGLNVHRCTVRPEGDPFKRQVQLPSWIKSGSEAYLIVDEGPGLSGSSFAAVSDGLEERGIRRSQIHFFPSHAGSPGPAASEQIQKVWQEIPRWVAEPVLPRLDSDKDWKFIGPTLPWPFDCSGEAERFARRSADLSCGMPAQECRDWWLGFKKFETERANVTPAFLAEHIAAVADGPLRLEDQVETEDRLRSMAVVNVAKYFGNLGLSESVERWMESVAISRDHKSSGDGQLAPANWVRDKQGKIWKLNTTGSRLSHFIPYRLPFLWDVAQAIIEWDLSPREEAVLCEAIAAENLCFEQQELDFFKLSVAAFELGKCVMLGLADKSKYERHLLAITEVLL
jgi:hypothetical protein